MNGKFFSEEVLKRIVICDNEEQKRRIDGILEERRRQIRKWGFQQHRHETWTCIGGEEGGECMKAILELREIQQRIKDWEPTGDRLVDDFNWAELRKIEHERENHLDLEVNQHAAVLVAWLEDFSDHPG